VTWLTADGTDPVAEQPPPTDHADNEGSGGLPHRPRSLRDPAGAVVAPMAYGVLALLVFALVWAGVRYNNLEDDTRKLAATQTDGTTGPTSGPAPDGNGTDNGNGNAADEPEPPPFPTEEPSDPEQPPPAAAETFIIGEPGEALFFDPNSLNVELGVPVLVRNTSQRRCTMTAAEGSDVVPAMLEGENNPVLESAGTAAANHTVTFLSPDEPGNATLRCDYEVTVDPQTESPTEESTDEGTPSGDESGPTPDGETESGTEEGSNEEEPDEATVQVLPSKELFVTWQG
jgi:hypothetical protein